MTIPLQSSVVYGPIDSRRFGKSLGINLLPSDQKICSFDCLYCQYGETAINKLGSFPDLGHIHEEVQERLIKSKENKEGLSWIMIAGNGEPTLHPQFHEAVKLLLSLREAYAPAVPIGILSNSSTCHRPDIQDSLLKLDGRFMKLDAGDTHTFHAINRPISPSVWKEVIGGLYHLHRIVIQSMFVNGAFDNTTDKAVEDWIRAVQYIQPESVQVYTVDRPTADKGILAVPKEKLEAIANRLSDKAHVSAFVFD